jgi:hypothetical protein
VDTTKSSATARLPKPAEEERLAELRSLEERYRQEILGEEERCELRERILRLRRKLGL